MATVHCAYCAYYPAREEIKGNLPWECCSCGATECQAVGVTAMAEPSTAELQKELCLACFCPRKGLANRWRDGLMLCHVLYYGSSLTLCGVWPLSEPLRATSQPREGVQPTQTRTNAGVKLLRSECYKRRTVR